MPCANAAKLTSIHLSCFRYHPKQQTGAHAGREASRLPSEQQESESEQSSSESKKSVASRCSPTYEQTAHRQQQLARQSSASAPGECEQLAGPAPDEAGVEPSTSYQSPVGLGSTPGVSDAGERDSKQQQHFARQQSPVELSTVSEASEELLTESCITNDKSAGPLPEWPRETLLDLGTPGAEATCVPAKGTPELNTADLMATTEQDLTHSEYTLRSQCSNTSMAMGSKDGAPANKCHQESQASLASSSSRRDSFRQQLAEPRRSLELSGGKTQASNLSRSSPPVDCPYVHDIQPLSPPPSIHSLASLHKRLSHDDTMEAIEDDVEGEEQELKLQVETTDGPPLAIAPPAGFSNSSDSLVGPLSDPGASAPRICEMTGDSIREEEEEGEDEESSISVSQQHGVVVLREPDGSRRQGRATGSSASSSSSSASQSSSSSSSSPSGATSTSSPTRKNQQSESQREILTPKGPSDNTEDAGDEGEATPRRHQPAAPTSSTESATHAILEHLSRHHADVSPLEEPAPRLELSRSVNPQMRREGWRRESGHSRAPPSEQTTATDGPPSSGADGADTQNENRAEQEKMDLDSFSPTGTMRRRTRAKTESKGALPLAEDTSGELSRQQLACDRRGPPLAQLKARQTANDETAGLRVYQATGGSMEPADTSICSSCSCMETGPNQAAVASQQHEAVAGEPSRRPQQPATWMSQEEGTVFTENYWLSHWLYISEQEEAEIWRRSIDMSRPGEEVARPEEPVAGMPKDMSETGSTVSERSFSSRYKSTTRKMIHRRATIEMYKRIMANKLQREKRVEISRSNGEFGFRIHGSRPVVVSAIERGTSAETCGLQVGDLIYAINGTNILDMAHSDVVRLAHSGKLDYPVPIG